MNSNLKKLIFAKRVVVLAKKFLLMASKNPTESMDLPTEDEIEKALNNLREEVMHLQKEIITEFEMVGVDLDAKKIADTFANLLKVTKEEIERAVENEQPSVLED